MTNLRERVEALWSGEALWDCPMARFSTLGVGGLAGAVIEPSSLSELLTLVRNLRAENIDRLVIGGGSNILVSDQGFAGVVIHLGRKFAAINEQTGVDDKEASATVEAGCSLARLVNWCLDRELGGLEFAAGIPGSIGGAVVMNAGAWGHELAPLVQHVTAINSEGDLVECVGEKIPFRYRSWGLDDLVAAVITLRFVKGSRKEMEATCHRLARQRRDIQPLGKASAGSFFKNPKAGPAAGKLIEDAGLKGRRVGDAVVSEKHANFLINIGHATASDFLELMRVVQEKVLATSNIWLEPEVKIIGDWAGGENPRQGRFGP